MNKDSWKEYANDFDNLTDEEVLQETEKALRELEEAESWLEAVASWEAEGKPRSNNDPAP